MKMMRKGIIFILLLSCFLPVMAQPYGNEWIVYPQQYFKMKVVKEGVYRITGSQLQGALVPVASVKRKQYQVFLRGEEIALYVPGDPDSVLGPSDFIEFYARRNDGTLDKKMYKDRYNQTDTNAQPNPRYSLFNDTAVYFLTWNLAALSGKRITGEADINFAGYTPAPYFFKEAYQEFTSYYHAGTSDYWGITDPDFSEGEGWIDQPFKKGESITKVLTTANAYTAGPPAIFQARMVFASSDFGTGSMDHHLRISLGPTILIDTQFDGYGMKQYSDSALSASLLGATTPVTFQSVDDLGVPADRSSVAWLSLTYPHTFGFAGESAASVRMILPDQAGQGKSYLHITSFNHGGSQPVLYDLTNGKRIACVLSGSDIKALVPNSGGEKTCYLTTEAQLLSPVSIKPVSTVAATFAKFTPIPNPGDSAFIILTHTALLAEAKNYENYRKSTGHNTIVVNAEDLYDHFGYGIYKHPLAIRNFLDYAVDNWTTVPRNLFIIGKGYDVAAMRNDSTLTSWCLVPTCGYPPVDNLYSSALKDGLFYLPAIATGRLAAQKPSDVTLYLNKVKEHESYTAPEEWMKNVLHFAGGQAGDPFWIYLRQYEDTIESDLFGGFVTTFRKTTSAPMEINQSDSLKNLINNGVSMMTFFGHATSSGFDQNTDAPSAYNNKGKYPFIIANSCFAGNIHLDGQSKSEEFVLIADKGAIGFISSVSLGLGYNLHMYTRQLYTNIGKRFYGQSVGKSIRETIRLIEQNDLYIKVSCLEMTLHGDPAIKIHSHALADLRVTQPDIFFNPGLVTTELDSFDINIGMSNLGRAVTDSFYVEVVRNFPDGKTSLTYKKQVPPVFYRDTLTLRMPVDVVNGIGLNTFHVKLDFFNDITEYSELNNTATAQLLIQSGDIYPVYPYKYAIIPSDTLVLQASTAKPFAALRSYLIEIDTTDLFNSPLKKSQKLTVPGGVLKWQPPLQFTDSTVYYWRVAADSAGSGKLGWRESSFQYIQGKRGWGQAHFFQFLKGNTYQFIDTMRTLRRFDFVNNAATLQCNTGKRDPVDYSINQTGGEYGACGYTPSIHIAVIDPVTLTPWGKHFIEAGGLEYNVNHQFGNANENNACRSRVENYFIFRSEDSTQMESMRKMMVDSVPDGHYLLAYSVHGGNFENWSDTLYQAFENLGSSMIRTLKNDEAYIFFVRKGDPVSAAEQRGPYHDTVTVTLNQVIVGSWYDGYLHSETIGPASRWDSLHWRSRPMESGVHKDSIHLRIIGIDKSGNQAVIYSALPKDSADMRLSAIDASKYPYLKLQAYVKDDSLRTPPQLVRWQVIYEEMPEAALNPARYFVMSGDSVQEGTAISFSAGIENLSDHHFDSLWVDYWIIDQNRIKHPLYSGKLKPLLAWDTLVGSIVFNTSGYAGMNSLWIEINPFNSFHQLEQYHFNNIGEIPFYVQKDITNPILDVTFDGFHIMDRDIVSARPHVVIQLTDENKFLALNDSALFAVYLKKPSATDPKKLTFGTGTGQMRWYPASLPKNSARIEMDPVLTEDGMYELTVKARDASGNNSGMFDYKINFEVVNRSTITEFMNYPNPFSTSTRFVFTLTGSELPTDLRIQIMTVTGKIVREILLGELGPVRIGRNITQYAWDGTDQHGDRLANGLYLYKVTSRINGSGIEKRETEADQYFTRGWGKMYILR